MPFRYWILLLTMICGATGLGQFTPPGVLPFEGQDEGSFDGMDFAASLSGVVTYVYEQGESHLISGGMNKVEISDFEVWETSTNGFFAYQLIYFEMKIGGISVSKFKPYNAEAAKVYANYRPVRFASYKFPSGQAIEIEIRATFSVRRTNPVNSPWSTEFTVSATTSVTPHNVGLNWQTVVDANGNEGGDYADQAQITGNNWQGQMSGMNHQARMPSPTSATTAAILSELATTTFLMPTTHGLTNGIEDSFGGDITWSAITAARAAGIAAGYPPANLALLMACYSKEMQDIKGTAQFAWFGTEGLLYSRGITAVNNEDGTNWFGNAPQLPVSEVYKLAMEAIAAGEFAIDIPTLSEKEGEGTTPVRYLAGSTPQTTFFEVISLNQLGDEYQRLKYVYLKENERNTSIDGGQSIWYLVEDLSHLRGE